MRACESECELCDGSCESVGSGELVCDCVTGLVEIRVEEVRVRV